jgi:hypothetical protein
VGGAADDRIARWERVLRADPGGAVFPALAELYRRAGRLADAERVVAQGLSRSPRSHEGRAVWLLVLEDAGRGAEARRLLEAWADAALAQTGPPPLLLPDAEEVSDGELERAFAAAEPDLAAMITPDSIAEEAALAADEPVPERSPLESGGAFATRTMADLLERQGDRRGAARIRAALDKTKTPDAPPAARPAGVIATLERWLENARRLQP